MNRRSRIYAVLLFLTLVVSAASIIKSVVSRDKSSSKVPSYFLRMKDFTITQYSSNFLVRRLRADDLRIEPRRFFVFNVRSVNEIVIKHARLSVYLSDKSIKQHDNPFSFDIGLFSTEKKGSGAERIFYPAGAGLITRAVIKGIQLEIYRDKRLILNITARVGYIHLKNKSVRLKDTVLKNAVNGKEIKSRLAIWDNKRQLFVLPCRYIFYSSEHIPDSGTIDIDLRGNISSDESGLYS